MTRRNAALVIVFTLLTCGIYAFYWHWVTTDELKRLSGKEDLNPPLDLVLGIVTCGIWYMYVCYRNMQLVHGAMSARGPHEDRSTLVLILCIASLFSGGITTLVAYALMQDEYNKVADGMLAPAFSPGVRMG